MIQLPVKIAVAKQDDFKRRLGPEISNLDFWLLALV